MVTIGCFAKARSSLDQALSAWRSVGTVDEITATLNNLGLLYGSLRDFDHAEPYYREALGTHLKRPDSADRNMSIAMLRHDLLRGRELPKVEDRKRRSTSSRPLPTGGFTRQ